MTRKEIKQFLSKTKVYVNGKSKEIQEKLFLLGYKWSGGTTLVMFEDKPFLYIRADSTFGCGEDMGLFAYIEFKEITAEQILALELTEPLYRPFKDEKECLEEMKKHNPFGWIMNDYCTTTVCLRDCSISLTGFPLHMFPFDTVFKNFKFVDGTPFGIKED